MPPPPSRIEQEDLQGNVLCGYGNQYRVGSYVFLRVSDPAAGRRVLGELAPRVTSAVPWGANPPRSTLNVALTYGGLDAVGVPERVLSTFPAEFRAGMAASAEDLGDVGPSRPGAWDPGLRPGEAHVLVTLFALDRATLDAAADRVRGTLDGAGAGLEIVRDQPVALLDHPAPDGFGREHFGFADGLSQPAIADPRAGPNDRPGQGTPARLRRSRDVAPGEFVLGYADEEGVVAGAPANPLRRNGTFTVVRKLHQDVAAFTRAIDEQARSQGLDGELLAAKLIGRWRDGTPLVVSPDADSSARAPHERFELSNDFRYGRDRDGVRCPLGAHIRRANPRDAFGFHGRLSKRHRIIRRGMPYGTPPAHPAEPDGEERGLLFVCHQASIARQFEVIQARWLNEGDAFGLGADKDLFTANQDGSGRMTVQGPRPAFLTGLPSFVTTRGGDYFFTPGISALGALSRGLNGPGRGH